jgi:hypothetical protein
MFLYMETAMLTLDQLVGNGDQPFRRRQVNRGIAKGPKRLIPLHADRFRLFRQAAVP